MKKSLNLPRLTDALIRAGMNQSDLAARLDVSREAVSNWMRGESFPQPDKLVKIGMLVGLKFDDLVQPPAPAPGSVPPVGHRRKRKGGAPLRLSARKTVGRVAEAAAGYGGPGGGAIVLYRAPDGTVSLDVRLERETVWLDAHQMALLFGHDQSVIARHLRNVFDEGELPASESNMQKMHIADADRPVVFYSLDVIISVGYRVKSKRGTQFRIWATRILRDHILKGYTVHERRLKELNQAVRLIADVAERRPLTGDEATALLRVVGDYSTQEQARCST